MKTYMRRSSGNLPYSEISYCGVPSDGSGTAPSDHITTLWGIRVGFGPRPGAVYSSDPRAEGRGGRTSEGSIADGRGHDSDAIRRVARYGAERDAIQLRHQAPTGRRGRVGPLLRTVEGGMACGIAGSAQHGAHGDQRRAAEWPAR